MKNYTPYIFAFGFYALGTKLMLYQGLETLGVIAWAIAFIITLLATIAAWIALFEQKAQATQYLMDSARHLNDDTIDRLLYAMGLSVKPRAPQQVIKTSITVNHHDRNGVPTKTKTYPDIPASPEQLQELIAGCKSGVPFSRRQWSISRNTFTQDEFSALQKYCIDRNLAASNGNGYSLTDEFIRDLEGDLVNNTPLPSPTPLVNMAQTA